MARQVQIALIDDIDGSEASESSYLALVGNTMKLI